MTREPGDKLIPKLIPVIRDTIISTKKGLASHEKEVRRRATQDIIDALGHEVAELYRPLVDKILDADPGAISPEVREIMHAAKSGTHQGQALSGLLLGGISGAISTLISNETAPAVYAIVGGNPNLDLDPQNAAAAVARGIVPFSDGASSAHQQGYSLGIFQTMEELAQTPLDPATAGTLVNREEISEPDALHWIRRAGYDESLIHPLLELRKQLLSPADAALAVLRNNITHDEGTAAAAAQGVSSHDFEVLIGNTGEPPGVADMLAMYRRGIIDEATLRHGILESRLRNEWIPAIEAYRFSPMSTADAITAAVQNHIPVSEAQQIAEQNGLTPAHFTPLLETAGEPLAKEELLRLYRRGVITEDVVKQGLRESRLKDKYIDDALKLAVTIPPLFTIESAIRAGAITDTQAAKWLAQDGYQPDAIKAIITAGHHVKLTKPKELTEGMLSELYQEQAISKQQFADHLKVLGYSPAETDLIIKLDDWKIVKRSRDNAISRVRAEYVGHKITRPEASAQLDALQVPSAMRDQVLKTWDIEAASVVRSLTPAQIAAAWKLGIMDTATSLAELVNLGYSGTNAGIILEIANKGPLTPQQQQGTF